MKTPKRIQLKRTAGWRKPEGVVVVARPSVWGNPFRVGDKFEWPDGEVRTITPEDAVELYELHIGPFGNYEKSEAEFETLRGKDVACWCAPSAPCHGDVLLRLANQPRRVS